MSILDNIKNQALNSSDGFKVGDVTLRTLEQQVQKNKEDIAAHYQRDRVLADWGIKVVGVVDTVDELPDPLTYGGEYGDCYAVGTSANYIYYIFTRPDINSGHPDDWWLDAGGLTIAGPQGPVGPQGPQGEQGKADKWYVGGVDPSEALSDDYVLAYNTSNNSIYQRNPNGTQWFKYASIKGPQGVKGDTGPQGPQGPRGLQGPKGETGIPGSAVNIIDILTSVDQLPDPNTVSRDSAYIVKTGTTNDVYVITGIDALIWKNAGVFSGGTVVTNNLGTPLATVDIDDYVKLPNMEGTWLTQAIVWDPNENKVSNITVANYPSGDASIVQRDSWGNIPISYWPGMPGWSSSNVINADYLTQNGYSKNPAVSDVELLPSPNHAAVAVFYQADSSTSSTDPTSVRYVPIMQDIRSEAVVQRNGGGHVAVPTLDAYNANLTYAMSMKTAGLHFQRKLYRHHKVLTATTDAGLYIDIHWDQYLTTSTAESKAGGGTILLTQSDLPEINATGVFRNAGGLKVMVNGMIPTDTNIQLWGMSVSGSPTSPVVNVLDPSGELGTIAPWPTYADLGYNWTITDTVTQL